MKKFILLLLCGVTLVGCASESQSTYEQPTAQVVETTQTETSKVIKSQNLYDTDKLIQRNIDYIEYMTPESWDETVSEEGILYTFDNMSVLIYVEDFYSFDGRNYEELSENEKKNECDQVSSDSSYEFTDGKYESYGTYKEEVIIVSDTLAYRFYSTIDKDNKEYYLDSIAFGVDNKLYVLDLWVESQYQVIYENEFESLKNSIVINGNPELMKEKAFLEFKEGIIELSKDFNYTDEATSLYLDIIRNSYKSVAKMNSQDALQNEDFKNFCLAVGYFHNNFEQTTNGGLLGYRGFMLMERVLTDNGDKQQVEKAIENVLDSMDGKTKVGKDADNFDQFEKAIAFSTGNYIVGDDIPAGKYDIIGVEQGNVHVNSKGKDYGDIVSEEIKLDEVTYANESLENGYTLEVVLGGKIKLQPK